MIIQKRVASPTSLSTVAARKPLDLRAVRLTSGFLADWQSLNLKSTIPHCISMLESSGVLDNFRRLIGESDSEYRGPLFADSDLYKVLESLGWEAVRGNSDQFKTFVEEAIRLIDSVQMEDGYIDTYFQGPMSGARLQDLSQSHEFYKLGHLIQAAIAWSHAGDPRLLEISLRYVALVEELFGADSRNEIDGHPQIETALVELSRITGDPRHRRLARTFVERRGKGLIGKGEFGAAYYQDEIPVRQATEATGHAVRQLYLMAGVADLEIEEPGGGYQRPLEHLWESVHAKKLYVTGGTGSRHRGEAFGDDYELPADRAYSETCAAIANFHWNWRMLLLSGQIRYADEMERGLYNVIAASTSIEGDAFFYSNPLQLRTGHAHEEDAPSARLNWYFCACCPPNLARFLASIGGYMLTVTDSSVDFHLYASGLFEVGDGVELKVMTQYPWQPTIQVTANRPTSKPTRFRIPSWADGATIRVDEKNDISVSGGYVEIPAGFESLTLHIPISIVFETAHPWVDGSRGAVAIRRGPVYYCLESADLPDEVALEDIRITGNSSQTTVEHSAELNVPVLRIDDAALLPSERDLYKTAEWRKEKGQRISVTAIPYARWANRKAGAMRVWIPLVEQ